MIVAIKYVSVIASIAGTESEFIELSEGATIKDVINLLCARHGSRLSNIIYMRTKNRKYMVNFIVNNANVEDTYILKDGEELTIILALGGG